MHVRNSILALAILASLLCVPIVSAQGTTVSIPYKHVSMDVPSDWMYQRNYTYGGIQYGLYMEGPSDGSLMSTVGLLMMSAWQGAVSQSSIWASYRAELDVLRSNPDVSGFVIVSTPTNKTLGGIPAIDSTLRFTEMGVEFESRVIVAVSADWSLEYDLLFLDEASDWSAVSADINLVVNSFEVEAKPAGDGGGIDSTVLAIGAIAVVLIVVIVVVVLLMMRKKKEPVPMGPPPVQPGYAPPPAYVMPPEPPKAP
jgi:hypothetical protein